jgi:hypothetical protein
MANALYTSGKTWILNNDVDAPSGNGLKIALLNSTYTFSAADDFLDDILGGERVALTGAVPSLAIATDQLDGGTATASAVDNGTITQAALYHDTAGAESTMTLIAFYDGLNLVTNGSNVDVDDNATQGFFELA